MTSLWPNQSSASLTSVQGTDAQTHLLPVFITFADFLLTHKPCQSFIRLYNYEPQTPLRMLRASVYGRMVCVRGTVVRVSSIRPQCARMAFKCKGGSHIQTLPLQQGKFATPTKVRITHTHTALTSTFYEDTQLSFEARLTSKKTFFPCVSHSVPRPTVAVVFSYHVQVLHSLKPWTGRSSSGCLMYFAFILI